MVENLSVIASVLILLLAVSMLIPTRQKHCVDASSTYEDKSLSTELLQLIFRFAIEGWKSRNTLRNHFETSASGYSVSIWRSLWNYCEQLVPLSWIEPKTKLLTRQSLYSLCAPADNADPTAWCFFAIWGSLASENTPTSTSLQQELGIGEMAGQWSHLLGNFGLIAADENDCIWLAMPYTPSGDSMPNISLARTLYSQLKDSQVLVNGASYRCGCRIRFTETNDSSNCEQTLKILLEPREQESPIQFFDGQQWHAIDLQAPAAKKEVAQPKNVGEDGSVETSPAQLSQFLADIKTKPAAMCVKDKSDDTSTAYGVQIEECEVDEIPLDKLEVKQDIVAAEQELAKVEATLQQDLNEIRQDIDTAIAEKAPAGEIDPNEKVTADDIAKLFAAARANT